MPARASTPCRKCGRASSGGYCDKHQEFAKGWQHKLSASQRGYGYQWQKIRKKVLARDRMLCQQCKAQGRYTQATEVDHITPKAGGGTDDASNLQGICHTCHREKTLREGGVNSLKCRAT